MLPLSEAIAVKARELAALHDEHRESMPGEILRQLHDMADDLAMISGDVEILEDRLRQPTRRPPELRWPARTILWLMMRRV